MGVPWSKAILFILVGSAGLAFLLWIEWHFVVPLLADILRMLDRIGVH